MDIKVEGITLEIMREALAAAGAGRRHILAEMAACSPPPRRALSQYAPRIMQARGRAGAGVGAGGRASYAGWQHPGRVLPCAASQPSSGAVPRVRCSVPASCSQPIADHVITHSSFCFPLPPQVRVPADKVGLAIGPGGRNVKHIQESTGVEVQVRRPTDRTPRSGGVLRGRSKGTSRRLPAGTGEATPAAPRSPAPCKLKAHLSCLHPCHAPSPHRSTLRAAPPRSRAPATRRAAWRPTCSTR